MASPEEMQVCLDTGKPPQPELPNHFLHIVDFFETDEEYRRAEAMKDQIVEVDIEDFIHHYLPFQPDDNSVKLAEDSLKQTKQLNNAGSGWKTFTPNIEHWDEKERLEKLGSIFCALDSLKLRGTGPTCRFELNPKHETALKTSVSGHESDSDGYLRLLKTTSPPSSMAIKSTGFPILDAPVNFEIKRSPNDCVQNRRQVIHAAGDVLDNDPCRQFSYSVTIEDRDIRLWYWSRSHCAASTSFDFTKEPRRFIYILLAFIFATPTELGYDDSIRRIRDQDGEIRYVYRINGRFFKTLRCVTKSVDLRISGRITRVWEAEEVESFETPLVVGSPKVIVRDVWLVESDKTEKQIQDEVFRSLDGLCKIESSAKLDASFSGEDDKHREELIECIKNGKYKNYFLSIIVDEKGRPTR
ncbi:hypothetical protein FRB99_003240, partial [Tulasnella sp. 403]